MLNWYPTLSAFTKALKTAYPVSPKFAKYKKPATERAFLCRFPSPEK
nr:MAG TPA: hypothetical protein [Caudoviricetes sp.]